MICNACVNEQIMLEKVAKRKEERERNFRMCPDCNKWDVPFNELYTPDMICNACVAKKRMLEKEAEKLRLHEEYMEKNFRVCAECKKRTVEYKKLKFYSPTSTKCNSCLKKQPPKNICPYCGEKCYNKTGCNNCLFEINSKF